MRFALCCRPAGLRAADEADPEVLELCYESSLNVAEELGATSVAFPAIGGGVYGWSARDIAEVVFVLFSDSMTSVFCQVFDRDQW